MDELGVRQRRKSSAARLREEWGHTVSKMRSNSMKVMAEDGKKFIIVEMRKRLETVT